MKDDLKERRRQAIRYVSETVISAAQNLEDVLLFRVFDGKRNGFYVDIGAGDPNADSVTNWFYRIGWTGINIEPNPMFAPIYAGWRPRDINLNLGISGSPGAMPFYKVVQNELGHGWGLSSFDQSAVARAAGAGFATETLSIETRPLFPVIAQHGNPDVDFLKIDVEGLERSVLLSANLEVFRPSVICIEAVEPSSATPSHPAWEDILTSARYAFALFDGVNAYYVKHEASYLLSQFNACVNINDSYRKASISDYQLPPPAA